MTISYKYESTIVEVKAYFGFEGFDCDPEEITKALGVKPEDIRRKGEDNILSNGRRIKNTRSSWRIESNSNSKDINIHLREILERLNNCGGNIQPQFGSPDFSVIWKGNYLYAGSGPFYEVDVLQGIAKLNGMLWHDIYQIDEE